MVCGIKNCSDGKKCGVIECSLVSFCYISHYIAQYDKKQTYTFGGHCIMCCKNK